MSPPRTFCVGLIPLLQAAGRNARAAVDAQHSRSDSTAPLVAGCLPPLRDCYGATDWLAGDSSGAAGDEARRTYGHLVTALSPFVDTWLVETASWASQAVVACHAAKGHRPVWVSWTLCDDLDAAAASRPPVTRSGQGLLAACDAVLASGAPVNGWLVNCTCPPVAGSHATLVALRSAAASSGATLVGCSPNGFRQTTSQWLAEEQCITASVWAPPTDFDADGAWLPSCFAAWGASLAGREGGSPGGPRLALGGCCGIGPPHVAALHALTRQRA